jgi:hypothetical protein
MAKGFFSQGVCLLTDGKTTIDDVKSALQNKQFEIVKQTAPQKDWQFGGPAVLIPFRPEVNGYAAADVENRLWPDTMGDPKKDPTTFGAWGMGYFGPFAFPGGLARASQHAWAWEPGRSIAQKHAGFVRIRLSYVFGAPDNAPILPQDNDPLGELLFLGRLVLALLEAPGVLCYFNPNGEVLRDRSSFREVWIKCQEQEKLPLPLWMNIRFFSLDDTFGFMDSVGNSQLDVPDVEAIFPKAKYDPAEIDYYLRNVTHYLLDLDREIQTGETIDGPGESDLSWTTEILEQGTIDPPRPVLRLCPKASQKAVRGALAAVGRSRN